MLAMSKDSRQNDLGLGLSTGPATNGELLAALGIIGWKNIQSVNNGQSVDLEFIFGRRSLFVRLERKGGSLVASCKETDYLCFECGQAASWKDAMEELRKVGRLACRLTSLEDGAR